MSVPETAPGGTWIFTWPETVKLKHALLMNRLLKTTGPIWLVGAWEKDALTEQYSAAWIKVGNVARARIVATIRFISRPLSFAEPLLVAAQSWPVNDWNAARPQTS